MVVGLPHSMFVLLSWKHVGGERQLKAFRKVGKVGGKEMNASEPLMKHC